MEQTKLQNFKMTKGEYGSILEVLYHSIEAKKYDLTERDCFDEINDFVTLSSIRKRFFGRWLFGKRFVHLSFRNSLFVLKEFILRQLGQTHLSVIGETGIGASVINLSLNGIIFFTI